ncbi:MULTISPECIES: hypothetical protein [unclassified Nocardia]|uniref:hypothetical protein n=1 Tax=unclassified Nocardia TaxID=2637762 RepID=UPI00278BF2C7|nr:MULTISPECIES: hypothetical protein [unclassified Nocardia]
MDNRQAFEIRFQLRAQDVYNRLTKRLPANVFPPIELEPYIPGVVTPEQLIQSAQLAVNAIPDTLGDGIIRRLLSDCLEDWLSGMALYKMSTADDGQLWMVRSALAAANRATDHIERVEEILQAEQDDQE